MKLIKITKNPKKHKISTLDVQAILRNEVKT